jgi:hypothetical protein
MPKEVHLPIADIIEEGMYEACIRFGAVRTERAGICEARQIQGEHMTLGGECGEGVRVPDIGSRLEAVKQHKWRAGVPDAALDIPYKSAPNVHVPLDM